jgi:hypothetical protein
MGMEGAMGEAICLECTSFVAKDVAYWNSTHLLCLFAQWHVCTEHEKSSKVSSGCQCRQTRQGATLAEPPYYNPFWGDSVVLDLGSDQRIKSGN